MITNVTVNANTKQVLQKSNTGLHIATLFSFVNIAYEIYARIYTGYL